MPSVDEIGVAVKTQNFADGAKLAHDLVSAAGNYGAGKVSGLARKLEQACRRSEGEIATGLYAQLRPAAQAAVTILQDVKDAA